MKNVLANPSANTRRLFKCKWKSYLLKLQQYYKIQLTQKTQLTKAVAEALSPKCWAQILALPFSNCVILGTSLNFSVPKYSPSWNGDDVNNYHWGLSSQIPWIHLNKERRTMPGTVGAQWMFTIIIIFLFLPRRSEYYRICSHPGNTLLIQKKWERDNTTGQKSRSDSGPIFATSSHLRR